MMKAQNTKNSCRKSAFLFILSILSIGFLVHLSNAASTDDNISFSFTRFNKTMLEIVSESNGSRTIYYKPMHLWDNSSGNVILADFTTQFSFSFEFLQGSTSGDVITFFLSPNGMEAGSRFVAVELDKVTDQSSDPLGMSVQVRIDLDPDRTVEWNDIENGREIDGFISFNSSTKNLSVVLLDADDFTSQNSSVFSIKLDLSQYLPEFVNFGFAGAQIGSWNFSSSLQVARPLNKSTNPPEAVPAPAKVPSYAANIPRKPPVISRRKSRTWLWVVLAISGCISALLTTLGLVWFFYRKRKYSSREDRAMSVNVQMEMVTAPRQFSYKELRLATNNFSDDGLLGEGGFGKVYLGFLMDMNCNVAVKRITPDSQQGMKEYVSEVTTVSRLRHRNLVQLIGWCHDNKDFLIVYEFLPNKSLDYHIHREPCLLTWDKRYKIATGLASALFYLQEECNQCVLHRDVKSSNVLLDLSFNAKLGDFGLARLVEHGQGSRTTEVMLGTNGYIAPECLDTYKAIKESDIYSFGIVALGIASGKKAIAAIQRNGKKIRTRLVEWVWELYGKESLLDAADPRLYGNYDMEQMERLLLVGLACAHPGYFARPSITQVVDILDFKAPLPVVPREMPLPSFGESVQDNSGVSSAFISLHTTGSSRSQPRISGSGIRSLKDEN